MTQRTPAQRQATVNQVQQPQSQGTQVVAPPPPPAALPTQDQLYEVGYDLALNKLGYKGMQSKIFADAFIGEYQRALENGLNNVLAIRFGAEFAGPFSLAFMHYLEVNDKREEDHDIYGGARAFAQMSFDVYEEQFHNDYAPIHEEKMQAKTLQEAISKALKTEVHIDNLKEALEAQYALIFKKGHEEGYQIGVKKGHHDGLVEGIPKGKEQGIEQGRNEGIEAGIIEGKKFGRQEGHTLGYKEGRNEAYITLTGSLPDDFSG